MIGYRDCHMTKKRAGVTLSLTVACEVAATLCVKASDGLTEVLPSAGAITGFILTTLLPAKVGEVIPPASPTRSGQAPAPSRSPCWEWHSSTTTSHLWPGWAAGSSFSGSGH